jgi:hypothetical protein
MSFGNNGAHSAGRHHLDEKFAGLLQEVAQEVARGRERKATRRAERGLSRDAARRAAETMRGLRRDQH